MAGLLDAQDAALMALGTGLLGGGTFAQAFGRGGQAALSTYAAMQQAQEQKALKERELAMQEELRKAQIQDYLSQAAHRKAQDDALLAQQQRSLNWRNSQPGASMPQVESVLSSGAAAGSVGPTIANAANLPPPNQADVLKWLERGAMEGEKGIDTLLKIHTERQPDWQVTNNYRWNKKDPGNTTGFMPSVSTSSDGQTTMLVPDGKGSLSVVVPQNALNAFSQYKDVSEASKARYEPFTYTPAGSNTPIATTKEQYARGVRQASAPQDITTNMVGDPATVRAQIVSQARALNMPQEEINAILAAYERQLSGGRGVAVQSEAEKKFAEGRAASGVKGLDDLRTKAQSAADALPTIWRAQELLKSGVLTGLGSDAKLNIARAVSAMGVPVPQTIANSQSFDADMAQLVGTNLKTIAGTTQLSDADLRFVSNMFGTRGLEGMALNYILNKFEEVNIKHIQQHQDAERNAPGGPAYSPMVQMPERKQSMQAPVRITGDADYNALPSGASFIGPDGRTRRKP